MYAPERIHTAGMCGVGTLAFLSALIALSSASEVVYIRSHDGRSTANSINLRWVNGARGTRPKDAVRGTLEVDPYEHNGYASVNEAEEELAQPKDELEDTYVCRALHRGIWLPGHLNTTSTKCTVSHEEEVFAYDSYQVLQNDGGATKLSWEHWDRSSGPSLLRGAVDVDGSGTFYVARREGGSPEEEKINEYKGIGKLDLRERTNHVTVTDARTPNDGPFRQRNRRRNLPIVPGEVERIYVSGKVLIASDPKRYELSIIGVDHNPKGVRSQPVVLATSQLVNNRSRSDGEESPMVNCVLSYDDEYTINWGQGKGILRGLPANMLNQGEDVQEAVQGRAADSVNWGQPLTWKLHEERTVEEMLPPGTAANVSLLANKTHTENLCTALVTIFFGDGSNVTRNVSVTRKMEKLEQLQVEVGPAYFLGNGTLATTSSTESTTYTTDETATESNTYLSKHSNASDETYFHPYANATSPPDIRNTSQKNVTYKQSNATVKPHVSPSVKAEEASDPDTRILSDRMGKKHEYETVKFDATHKKNVGSSAVQTLSTLWGGFPSAICAPIAFFILRMRMIRF